MMVMMITTNHIRFIDFDMVPNEIRLTIRKLHLIFSPKLPFLSPCIQMTDTYIPIYLWFIFSLTCMLLNGIVFVTQLMKVSKFEYKDCARIKYLLRNQYQVDEMHTKHDTPYFICGF